MSALQKISVQDIVDGICPGGHLQFLDEVDDPDSILEPCKAFKVFRFCQHIMNCECFDYSKGNDCKHIMLGNDG